MAALTRPLVPESVRVLDPLVTAGVLSAGEIAVADAVGRLGGPHSRTVPSDPVVLGTAIVALGRRLGHSCVDLARAGALCRAAAPDPDTTAELDLPEAEAWVDALSRSGLVQIGDGPDAAWDRPLVLDPDRGRLWLARYAHYERTLRDRLVAAAAPGSGFADDADVAAAVDAAFAAVDGSGGRQRDAVTAALRRRLSFVVGGPGTGKTWTVGRLLDAYRRLAGADSDAEVALAAPTGKAAERLTEAVGGAVQATTIHRLLGLHPDSAPGVDPPRILPHRLVVVDEASMIDLAMMTRLVGALAADAHLVFVGDPDQLLSVEVGSVLRDVVDAAADPESPLSGSVTELDESHRFGGQLAELATAIRAGDGAGALDLLLDETRPALRLVDPGDTAAVGALVQDSVIAARRMLEAAQAGDGAEALRIGRSHKVLAAVRAHRFGLGWWNTRIASEVGLAPGVWLVGRPVIVTRNDPANGVFNGDVGVTVPDPDDPLGMQVALAGPDGPRLIAPSRLRSHEDWWAMTIHKSQGSEFERVVVALPEVESPIVSRELLYTAVTRAKAEVTVVATPTALTAAATRRIDRASGLRDRLGSEA